MPARARLDQAPHESTGRPTPLPQGRAQPPAPMESIAGSRKPLHSSGCASASRFPLARSGAGGRGDNARELVLLRARRRFRSLACELRARASPRLSIQDPRPPGQTTRRSATTGSGGKLALHRSFNLTRLVLALTGDAMGRVGHGPEAQLANQIIAGGTAAEGALFDPP